MFVNAFHKDYVSTYMPEFLSTIRSESAAKANGEKFGSKSRATRESANSSVNTISTFPKTKPAKKLIRLEVREYFTFSRAGTANTTKVKKK